MLPTITTLPFGMSHSAADMRVSDDALLTMSPIVDDACLMILLFGHRRVELCGEWMIERMEASGSGWKAWARRQSKASRGIDLVINIL